MSCVFLILFTVIFLNPSNCFVIITLVLHLLVVSLCSHFMSLCVLKCLSCLIDVVLTTECLLPVVLQLDSAF